MYKTVFKEGHGELAVLILMGVMQLNPCSLLIKHKRYEIWNLDHKTQIKSTQSTSESMNIFHFIRK